MMMVVVVELVFEQLRLEVRAAKKSVNWPSDLRVRV